MTTLVTPTLVWALAMPDGVTPPASLRFQNTSPLTKIGLWVGTVAPDDTALPADIVAAGQDAIVQLSAGTQLYAKAMGGGYVRGLVAIDISTASGQAERSADVDIQYEYFLATAAFADVQIGDRLRQTTFTNLSTGAVTSSWVNTSNNNAAVTNPPAASLAAITRSMLTNEELRAAAVPVSDPEVRAKLDSLLTALTGNPASITALTEQQITLLTQLGQYNDGVEGLLTTATTNTANLETLLTQLGLNTDQVESIMAAVRDRLPAALGAQLAAGSLSVVMASDHGPIPVTGPLTAAQLSAAALATNATALEAQSPMGWEEDAAGNITRVFRCLPNGAVQQHTLTSHDMGDGKTAYIPGPWQAAVGIPA